MRLRIGISVLVAAICGLAVYIIFYSSITALMTTELSSKVAIVFGAMAATLALTVFYFMGAKIGENISEQIRNLLTEIRSLAQKERLPLPDRPNTNNEIDELRFYFQTFLREMDRRNEVYKSEKLRAEDANDSKSEFIANISHELRTPMHSILSYTKILLKKIDVVDKKEIIEHLMHIQESSNRLLNNVNDILDVSKIEAGKMKFNMSVINMHDLLDDVMREVQSFLLDKEIKLEFEQTAKSLIVECDPNKLTQVLRNMVFNAIKFTKRGGKINVRFSSGEGKSLQVSVRDNGVGIPDTELKTIFEKFEQGSSAEYPGGTGLGLYLCRKIVEGHEGKIWAENNKDGGSTFYFVIPTKQQSQAEAA